VAVGVPGLITKEYLSAGQVVIDVGINPVTSEGKNESYVTGDVNFKEAETIVSMLSPVPGGVGPLTVASLFANVIKGYNMAYIRK
jgi:methylenetetrahydrofolate dehydrogenase (NADP+)/methenyltetrahydrofolate cyclohydrolase